MLRRSGALRCDVSALHIWELCAPSEPGTAALAACRPCLGAMLGAILRRQYPLRRMRVGPLCPVCGLRTCCPVPTNRLLL
jgi:hypothetical protein